MCNKNNLHSTQVTPFLDKISQISIFDLLIQHLGTCNHYKLFSWGVEHQGVFWDEINSCTHGQGLLWNNLCSDTWKHLSWRSGTVQMDRDHTETSPELRTTLFPCFPAEAPLLPNPGSSPALNRPSFTAQTRTCAMDFIWNILLQTWWHSTRPCGVFQSSVYLATAANPGC